MNNVTRIKKTGKIVHVIDKVDSMHSLVLFPFDFVSRKGNRGVAQRVRTSNLVQTNEYAG
jgi:hypothetical protein